jgi:hypothetical protein
MPIPLKTVTRRRRFVSGIATVKVRVYEKRLTDFVITAEKAGKEEEVTSFVFTKEARSVIRHHVFNEATDLALSLLNETTRGDL